MYNEGNLLIAETIIHAPGTTVWKLWNDPVHIAQWNNISSDWHTPLAENDLRVGGKLFLRMETKDGSEGFDYSCVYDEVVPQEKISHTGTDGRKTTILFEPVDEGIKLTEIFEPEKQTPLDAQQAFCQSIVDHFRDYVENAAK